LGDEIFAVVGDVSPYGILEREFSELDFLHDFLIRRAIKWRNTGQNNEGDDTAGPDVALGSVIFGEDLWSNVVRSTELLVKFLALIEDEGGTEVNDLDLIELLVLLE